MTLWQEIQKALAAANAAMATDACVGTKESATNAEMALLNLKLKIEAYLNSK